MQEKHYAYIARCADGTFYAGYTTDIAKRELVHNSGKGSKYVRSRLPAHIIYQEEFTTKGEALMREAQIKKLTRAQKEKLIAGQNAHFA